MQNSFVAALGRGLLLAGLAVLLHSAAQAQAPGGGGPQPGGGGGATGVPIDGGASLLLAGGVAYGWRRFRRAR